MLHLIGWAIFGLVAGAIARLLHPGRDPMNWFWTMALGIAGALLGGWIFDRVLGIDVNNSTFWSWVSAVGGSILLLILYHLATGRRPADVATGTTGPATGDDYKKAVFDDLSRGPNG